MLPACFYMLYSDDVVLVNGVIRSVVSKEQSDTDTDKYIVYLNDGTCLNVERNEPVSTLWGITNEI